MVMSGNDYDPSAAYKCESKCIYMKHKKRKMKICLEHKSEEKKIENITKGFFKKLKRSSQTKEKYNGKN